MVTEISLVSHSRVNSQMKMLSPQEETKTTVTTGLESSQKRLELENSQKITFNTALLKQAADADLRRKTTPVSPSNNE